MRIRIGKHLLVLLGLMLLQAAPLQAGQALLWRVESGTGAVSHLFGTIHSEDPRVTTLPAPVEQAFSAARQVVLEMALTPAVQQKMAMAIMLPASQRLSDLIDGPLYRDTLAAMAARGYPEAFTARLRPWAVVLTLSMPQPESGAFLDKVLHDRALRTGKRVVGLESVEEQLDVFRALSLAEQRMLLRQTLRESRNLPSLMESTIRAWLERDLQALVALNRASMGALPAGLQQRFAHRLLEARNHRMAERAEPILQQGGAFIAVGALHLVGEEGLVALLRQRGMKVTPVY